MFMPKQNTCLGLVVGNANHQHRTKHPSGTYISYASGFLHKLMRFFERNLRCLCGVGGIVVNLRAPGSLYEYIYIFEMEIFVFVWNDYIVFITLQFIWSQVYKHMQPDCNTDPSQCQSHESQIKINSNYDCIIKSVCTHVVCVFVANRECRSQSVKRAPRDEQGSSTFSASNVHNGKKNTFTYYYTQ